MKFHSYQGTTMPAVVEGNGILGRMVKIRINGDPFPTNVDHRQLERTGAVDTMPTATAPSPKELRRQAKNLGISGWRDMTRAELAAAVEAAEETEDKAPARRATGNKKAATKKASAKKAPASKKTSTAKKSARKTAPAASNNGDSPNPFRPGTNLFHITEALMEGGKRSQLVRKLRRQLEFNPRTKSEDDFDVDEEIDRRLKVVGYLLKNQHGFDFEHTGRGKDAYIKVTPA